MPTNFLAVTRALRYLLCLSITALMCSSAYAFAEDHIYLTPSDNDIVQFLPSPPSVDSAAYKRDLCSVLTAQRTRTAAEIKRVVEDKKVSVFRYSDVLGSTFTADGLPKTAALFKAAHHDARLIIANAKSTFERARPFVSDARVRPLFKIQDERYRSYPSGHAAAGYLNAILLAKMLPEKRDALFARGRQYGDNRIIAGVHFPSDLEAGRLGAALVAAALFREPRFQRDFKAASEELREALGVKQTAK